MSIAELRLSLINQINSIDDDARLIEIWQHLKFELEDSIYITNESEKSAIDEARAQIKEGKGKPNSIFQDEIEKWLKE